MKMAFFAILLVFTVSLQLAVFSQLRFFGAVPDLILALSLALAILKNGSGVKWFVLIMAVFYDLTANLFFGLFSLNIFIVFCFIRWLSRYILKQSGFWAISLSLFIGVLSFEALAGIFKKISSAIFSDYFFSNWPDFFSALPANLICNFLLSFFVFYALKDFFPDLLRMASKRKKRASLILPDD